MDEIHFKKFLESTPPGKRAKLMISPEIEFGLGRYLKFPDLKLFCPSKDCQGERNFSHINNDHLSINNGEGNYIYLNYQCKNCRDSFKVYAVKLYKDNDLFMMLKLGEYPTFGTQTPSQVLKLVGGERELFLMGRKCENQGMGIGAFIYYRRVLDSQRIRIFDELIKVVSKINPNDAIISELEIAKKETQFTKAVNSIKGALPESLNINGHNPLTLLHSALSEGVHEHDDQICLDLASSVRTVLFEFAEKLAFALKEKKELYAAVNKLANKNHKK
ncbi:TPA: hypothetical protein ACWMJN_001209 [Morganella morganii]